MRFIVMLTGFLMACADSVPGVSGGTIAFVLGVYDELINSIKNVTKFNFTNYKFLIQIGIAWIIGLIIANTIVVSLFETQMYELSSLFLGFIVLSIPLTIRDDKELMSKNLSHVIYTIIGAVVVVSISYFSQSMGSANISSEVTAIHYLYLMLCGAIAVSCMLLPGISGSTVMIIFGIYFPLQEAIHGFFRLDFSTVPFLMAFGIGCIIGFVISSRVISYVFEKYRSQTLYTVQGLLIGSLYAIIVGPTSMGMQRLDLTTFSIVAFVLGCVVMVGLEQIKIRGMKNDK